MTQQLPPDMPITGTLTASEWVGLRRLIGRYVVLDEGAAMAMKIEALLAAAAPAEVSDGGS